MKVKLLLAAILAVLGAVAYTTYREYSSLRAINSYESCAAAKGSIIQESYPATCVTKLGARFTQPIKQNHNQIAIYSGDTLSFNHPSCWQNSTQNGNVIFTENCSEQKILWLTISHAFTINKSKLYPDCSKAWAAEADPKYTSNPYFPCLDTRNLEYKQDTTIEAPNNPKSNIFSACFSVFESCYTYIQFPSKSIELKFYMLKNSEINQILSTFKFTDQ